MKKARYVDKFGKQHINAGMVFDNIKKALKNKIKKVQKTQPIRLNAYESAQKVEL